MLLRRGNFLHPIFLVIFGNVRMGNDGSTNAVIIGDVHLKNINGSRQILKNVKHISDICMNLISKSKLDDEVSAIPSIMAYGSLLKVLWL